MNIIKDRTLVVGQVVEVYFNLHKKMYSIRDKATGLVVAHANEVILMDATFKVSEAGRQRVLTEKKKNVHAFVVGKFAHAGYRIDTSAMHNFESAYYNPYKTSCFRDTKSGAALKGAEIVHCQDKQAYYVNGVTS
jgi:hypothetical protein